MFLKYKIRKLIKTITGKNCENCKYGDDIICPYCTDEEEGCEKCFQRIRKDVLSLLNRQQAEIEKLNVELVGMRGACESYKIHYDNAQAEIQRYAESIKQFQKKMKL